MQEQYSRGQSTRHSTCLHICVRLPYDVAVHRTLAYAKSYSSDIACIPYRLYSCSCIEVRLMMTAVAYVRSCGSICSKCNLLRSYHLLLVCLLSGCIYHDAFISIYQRFISTSRNVFTHTSMSSTQRVDGHCNAQLPPFPHTLRRRRAHIHTPNLICAVFALERGLSHPQRRPLPFVFVTDLQSMYLGATPQRGRTNIISSSAVPGSFRDPSHLGFDQFCCIDSELGRPYQGETCIRFPSWPPVSWAD